MKSKKHMVLIIGCLIGFCLNSWADTKKITRMGQRPFMQVKNSRVSADVLMGTLEKQYAKDMKYGFEIAGNPELYDPFLTQLRAANFGKKRLPGGTVFTWMLFRSQGKVQAQQNVEWAGKEPLAVYSFTVSSAGKNYELVMPEPCGNLALLNVVEANPASPVVCDLKVSPLKANANETIVVDMSGSQNAVSMSVAIYDGQQNLITTSPLTPNEPRAQMHLAQPGNYVFKGKVIGQDGREVTGPDCEASVKVNATPNCKLTVSCLECKNGVNKAITFDASGSSDPDGEITKAVFKVTDPAGKVRSYTATRKPFIWTESFPKTGAYVASVEVFDDAGAVNNTDFCEVAFNITQKRLFLLVEGGPGVLRGTFTTMLWARIGILYQIVPGSLDFILSVGGGSSFRDEPWKTFWMGNALLSVHKGIAFLSGGLGFSTKERTDRKGGIDLVGQLGIDVLKVKSSVGSILLELRAPVITSDRPFDKHHKWLLGFRYIF